MRSENMSPAIDLSNFTKTERRRLKRTPAVLSASVRTRTRYQWIFCGLVCILSVLIIQRWAGALMQNTPWQFWVALVIPFSRQAINLIQILGLPAYPLETVPDHLWGRYSAPEIRDFADSVAEKLNGREVPNIYVAIDKTANAMAINSWLINFVPRLNAIFLNSYLLKSLSPQELKAILAHELAHFHCYMSPLTRNSWVAAIGDMALLVSLFHWFSDLSVGTWIFIIVMYWKLAPFNLFYNLIDLWTARDLEFCADIAAAQLVGGIHMINALLKINDRAEIFEVLEERVTQLIENNSSVDANRVVQKLNDILPESQISVRKARRLLRESLKSEETDLGGNKDENKKLLKSLRARRKLRKALRVYHWNRFDIIHRDDSLDARELADYLQSLVGGPLHATHKVSSDHPDQEPYQTHPSMKKRILYLYMHCLNSGSQ